ncbi:hypothetical protein GQX74_009554 [Glossina fuscipes]|nr:hypothetical protein GQX74_009554 [Glossina fuscipes]
MVEDPKDGQQIVRIIASREQSPRIVTIPTKFRKNVWVKRRDFILVELIEELKQKFVSSRTYQYVKAGIWPECFKRDDNVPNGRCASNYVKKSCDENVEEFEEKFSGSCHLSPNRNRPSLLAAFEDESASSEDDI